MIIEIPNYIDQDMIDRIKSSVKPHINQRKLTAYNRDGNTVNVSSTQELSDLDNELQKVFESISSNIITQRFKPQYSSADSGYEYHLYHPQDVCHYHSDGEISDGLLRFATVIIHLTTIEEGGETIFPSQNKTIKSEAGKVVIFPPYGMFGHYTTPAPVEREILMTWFVYDKVRINFV